MYVYKMMSNVPAASIFSTSLHKKITLFISFLFAAILFYLANKYIAVADAKFANAKEFVPPYEATSNQFWRVGIIIFFTCWIWANVVAINTRKLFWLWLPFLFVVVVAIGSSYQEEHLFHFKKANGLWKGGFSLSYFFAAGRILLAGFFLLINYALLKKYFKKRLRMAKL